MKAVNEAKPAIARFHFFVLDEFSFTVLGFA